MLSARLVQLIEGHAEDLTRAVLGDLENHPRTPSYHRLAREELYRRAYDVFHNLGRWLGEKSEDPVASTYGQLGRMRRAEGIPLSEVVFCLTLTKERLYDYIRSAGLVGTAVDLYQEEELTLLLGRFFDKAVYYTVKGYEEAAASRTASGAA